MDLDIAKRKATQILEQECYKPTVDYGDLFIGEWDDDVGRMVQKQPLSPEVIKKITDSSSLHSSEDLYKLRKKTPRHIQPVPEQYVFRSRNFELLRALFSQIQDKDRSVFIAFLVSSVTDEDAERSTDYTQHFPSINGVTSELPLVAEFCIRSGYGRELFESVKDTKTPTIGIAMMLRQVEELIALNFTVFSQDELEEIPDRLQPLEDLCEGIIQKINGSRSDIFLQQDVVELYLSRASQGIREGIEGIRELCREARYLYVVNELEQMANFEINHDKLVVENYLAKMGFGDEMIGALDAAEKAYSSATTAFDLKNCFSHLRSFLEHLHRKTAKAIEKATGKPNTKDTWGASTYYLRQNGLFTLQHEDYITSLYTLMSDTAVHPLGADREYARLLRNMVIEYGVMFLSMLDGKGVKI